MSVRGAPSADIGDDAATSVVMSIERVEVYNKTRGVPDVQEWRDT
jgi:hypothetical protein